MRLDDFALGEVVMQLLEERGGRLLVARAVDKLRIEISEAFEGQLLHMRVDNQAALRDHRCLELGSSKVRNDMSLENGRVGRGPEREGDLGELRLFDRRWPCNCIAKLPDASMAKCG